jgi:hypothetical protein
MEPTKTGSEYREDSRKMSKSNANDTNPIIITDEIKISALQSEVNYWKFKYEWIEKYFSNQMNIMNTDISN